MSHRYEILSLYLGINISIKIDIPDFEGNLQPDDFLDWLETIEHVFECKEVTEEKK